MTSKFLILGALLTLTACQTIGTTKPSVVAIAPTSPVNSGAAISGGGLVGGTFGAALSPANRLLALNSEYRALEYGKAGEAIDWIGSDSQVFGQVKAAQPYRVGSQDCRQYSHALTISGIQKAARGTACRNNDGSWTLLE